jgi:hypothetical protein
LILSTHGLLGPGKGIEYAIDAMPEIVKKFPNAMFLIAGVTHPSVLEHSGEEYRNELVKKVSDLGLKDRVIFYNHYLSLKDLFTLLEMTDVYVSTSLNPDQAVSGTLSYALGSGRPVVSTAFVHAQEDVTDETGILVGFKDPAAFAEAITGLLRNAETRRQMGREAYFRTRHMMYPNVALSYVNLFSRFAPSLIEAQRGLAPVNFAHLAKMTDDFGVIQFSKLAEPDVSSGYTADDNSRALAVAVRRCGKSKDPETLKLVSIYFNFLKNAFRPDGNFSNYFDAERRPDADKNIKEVSEDATARLLAALACAASASSIPEKTRIEARGIFEQSFGKNIVFSSPRATAIYAKALAFLFSKKKDERILSALKFHCDRLLGWYEQSRSADWEWFEKYLTYSNAVLPEALLAGCAATGDGRYLDAAKKTMEFLISQTWKDGVYVPIGQQGWYMQGGTRQYFDQQPEDVAAAVEALNAFYRATKDRRYRELAHWAFDWFLGRNVIGQVVCDLKTGACYDGLGDKYVNLNQGAESTISFLSARLSFDE